MFGLLLLILAATPPAYHLDVIREGATAACRPDGVGERLVALLGRDPLLGAGDEAVRFVVTTRSRPRWSAEIRVVLPTGEGGLRTITIPASQKPWRSQAAIEWNCATLDETVALAVALALEPMAPIAPIAPIAPMAPQGTPAKVDSTAKARSTGGDVDTVHMRSPLTGRRPPEDALRAARRELETPRLAPSRPDEAQASVALAWRLGVMLSAGLAPEVALAPELGLSLGTGPWTVELGARVHTSSSRAGPLSAAVVVWAAYADACLGGGAQVCVGLDGGAYRADASTGGVRPHLAPGLALKVGGGGLELALRISAPLWRQRWEEAGAEVWRMPPWLFGLAVGVGLGQRRDSASRDGSISDAPMALR